MKLTFSLLAILAICPTMLVQGQSSPPRVKIAPPPTKASVPPNTVTISSSSPGAAAAAGTPTAGAPAARTDVYHVFFAKAALGKSTQLADSLKGPNPMAPIPGHSLVLRHQEGDSWDYAVIQHQGTTATVAAARPTPAAAVRDLADWHNDTFVNGPSWSEFTKAMGIDESDKTKNAGSVYVVSVYRPAAGHRDQLEKMLSEGPGPGDTSVGNVLMQHLEGGPWTFLSIARYNSWEDFGKNESNAVASMTKNEGGWFQLREHVSFHTDTLTDRIAP